MSAHEQTPESINQLVITGTFGFLTVDGPFPVEKEGTKWTIAVSHDDLSPTPASTLEGNVGDGCVLLADCEPVGGGLIDLVDNSDGEGEVHIVVDQYARGGPDE